MQQVIQEVLHPAVRYHEELAPQWEAKYSKPSFLEREEMLLSCLRELNISGGCWLDAGCGSGRLARLLAVQGCRVEAVDASPAMVAVARRETAAAGVSAALSVQWVGTIEALPFADGAFEGVLCSSVLEYVPDPGKCLSEFARVLKPGGVLLLSVPNRVSVVRRLLVALNGLSGWLLGKPWLPYLEFSRHEYSRASLVRFLGRRGFETGRVLYFGGPLPVWLRRWQLGGTLLLTVGFRRARP